MGKRRPARDFTILEEHALTRKKSKIGYLYKLEDECEMQGFVFVFADHLKHAHSCSCIEREPRYLCQHIKFIERRRERRYVEGEGTTIITDPSRLIESSLIYATDSP